MQRNSFLAVCFTLLTALAPTLFAQTSPTTPTTTPAHTPIRLVVVGDSTVCNYPDSRPERGWGQFLQEHFTDDSVKVINLAASGRSTKTFINEGRWQKALAEHPDYVLIQFGHNDSHDPSHKEATDAHTTYKQYLHQYVDESRANHATPILVTPMVRRGFTPEGKINEDSKGNLLPYATAMKQVAQETHTPVIDLYTASKSLNEQLGPEAANTLANKPGDNTHFNEKGARAMADLVLKALPTAAPDLAKHLKTP